MHMAHGFPVAGQLSQAHQSIPPHLQNGHQVNVSVPNMMMPPSSQEQQMPGNSQPNQQMQQQHQNQNMPTLNSQHFSQEQHIQMLQQRQNAMSPHNLHHQQQQQPQQQQQQQPTQMPHHHQQQQQLQNQQQQIPNHPPANHPPNQANIPNSQPQHSATGNFPPPQNFPINMQSQMNMPPQNNAPNPHPFNAVSNHHQMMPNMQQSIANQMHPSPIHNNMVPINMAINQPVSSTILPSNDSRTNIPVYQQQR